MKIESLYEEALIIRSRLGDDAAFADLYRLHAPAIVKFTERMLQSSSAQVDDVVQEIWISVFKNLPRLEQDSKFRPWLFRIARDRIYQEYRRSKRVPETTAVDDMPVTEPIEPQIDVEDLQQRLNELTAEHREAVVLHYLENLSYEEISQITKVSIGTVRSRLFYARQAIRSNYLKKI